MPIINVRLPRHTYPVLIGQNLNKNLINLLKRHAPNNRVFVFFDSTVFTLYVSKLEKQITVAGVNSATFVIPTGESSKSQKTLNTICDFLLEQEISRGDLILAVGGGVVTDLVGYAAATILRGVKWGIVSTTLLGMVDAAIGGKTGINHPRGKNLIGAFWQPSFVICDLVYLYTLPKRELVAGLGEILKYGGLIGSKIICAVNDYLEHGLLRNMTKLRQLIYIGAQYKARLVMADERESGRRMLLNFGHTFAHAIETTLGFGKLLHGEAVVIGLLAAVLLSRELDPSSSHALRDFESLVRKLLRFIRYYPLNARLVMNNMNLDKKRAGQTQKFVLLHRPGKPFIASDLKKPIVKKALSRCLATYKELGVKNV